MCRYPVQENAPYIDDPNLTPVPARYTALAVLCLRRVVPGPFPYRSTTPSHRHDSRGVWLYRFTSRSAQRVVDGISASQRAVDYLPTASLVAAALYTGVKMWRCVAGTQQHVVRWTKSIHLACADWSRCCPVSVIHGCACVRCVRVLVWLRVWVSSTT